MRNPDRIPVVLKYLETIWKKVPDLRLGQLIWWLAGGDPFSVEDYDMIKGGAERFEVDMDVDWSEFPEYFIGPNPWSFKEILMKETGDVAVEVIKQKLKRYWELENGCPQDKEDN